MQRKFSAGRFLASGGLMLTKKDGTSSRSPRRTGTSFSRSTATAGRPWSSTPPASTTSRWEPPSSLRWRRTSRILIERLRQAAPHARYDERLANRAGRARILGPLLKDRHLDIAISLLARVMRAPRPQGGGF